MRSRNVEVGKVCRVGLVQVVVYLENRRVRGGNHGLEESTGAEGWRFAPEAVVEYGVEYAVLSNVRKLFTRWGRI